MRLSCLSEYFDACRTGYLVPRNPLRRFDVPEVLPARVVPALYRKRFILSQASNPLQRPRRVPPWFLFDGGPSRVYRAPPLRFLAPSAVMGSANRLMSGSTRTPSLYDLSQVLEGFILAELCRFISSCCRSWGSSPPELFPADQLCQVHHLVIPSRRFVLRSMIDGCALRGFRTSAVRHPTQEYCIPHQAAALLGFHPLPRCPCFRARCVSRRTIRS